MTTTEIWEWDEVPLPGVTPTRVDPHPTAWPLSRMNPDGSRGLHILRHAAPWPVEPKDAALIVAAPSLLAAALGLVTALDEYDGTESVITRATDELRDAIEGAQA